MEAQTVATIIVEEVVARFGVPQYIHSDQGKQFEGKLFREMCQLLHINKTRTTPYHPQSDGMVERFNKTLASMLSAYVNEHHSDWDTYIPYVMMAYRSSTHETIGYMPNRLMLGREVATPLDLIDEMPRFAKAIPQHRWVWELQERMEEAHSFVREKSAGAMLRQKQYHDQKLSWQAFVVGEMVYVFFPHKKQGTITQTYKFLAGAFQGVRGKPQVIHVDRIRKKYDQYLRGETSGDRNQPVELAVGIEEPDQVKLLSQTDMIAEFEKDDIDDRSSIDSEPEALTNHRQRHRQPPRWMKDYVHNCTCAVRETLV
ncbi:uncharacterized protein K02A2.6-like [Pecten maximus]|uniref:uncharacterized protein K02A2.6-like n=1 Tax=Pecten maximus TaxID=6579 RepID=UPI0014591910|nr:uncharacterized protein K02A2.6-like [Pecten maximus]